MLRTINNMIRTLLFQASMPPEFWVEALHTATHILNILPSAAINNEIPYTQLFKTVPSYHHLCTFGCLCYPNLLPTKPHKLAQRSTPCAFLGYPTDHRGYRCLDLSTRRIILSRHVVFDEMIFPLSRTSLPSSSLPDLVESPPPPIPRQAQITNMPLPAVSPQLPPSTQNTHSMVT